MSLQRIDGKSVEVLAFLGVKIVVLFSMEGRRELGKNCWQFC